MDATNGGSQLRNTPVSGGGEDVSVLKVEKSYSSGVGERTDERIVELVGGCRGCQRGLRRLQVGDHEVVEFGTA